MVRLPDWLGDRCRSVKNCAQRWRSLDNRMRRVGYVMYAMIIIVLLGGKDGLQVVKQLWLG